MRSPRPEARLALAHAALVVVSLIYGANYIIAKGLMPDRIGPSGFITLRVTGAGLLFWLLMAARRPSAHNPRPRISRSDYPRLALCGLTGVAINQLMFFNGLSLTSPVNASLIMTINPIWVLLASFVMLGSPITRLKALGIALGAAGAIGLLLNSAAAGSSPHAHPLGDAMVLVNALSYGVYLVAVRPLMSKYSPLTVIAWVFLFGWLFSTPFGAHQVTQIRWSAFALEHWGALAFVVVATTFLAYLLNIFAIKYVQPTVVAAYIYLQPLLAVAFSWLLSRGGGPNYLDGVGAVELAFGGMICIGVFLVSRVGVNAHSKT
ncbi:MAG: DMT family transporter [Flavobacteriales bacterium]|nr:DMT family transporter [Flavobacteriales bacterium]